ncbi:MAG: ThiF family adenylyltransferase [Methanobacteriota archaeon]|nr:MAG: ThiF family adenylyltransferase [Euryarchaeota archaeon]
MKSDRYSRQEILSEIGEEGQRRLSEGSVMVIGLGALGSVSSTLLARAGVGRLLVIDRDIVELNNLQRQILFSEEDVGEAKAAVAVERLKRMNSEIKVEDLAIDLNYQNIEKSMEDVDVVVDGTDNMETRFLINDFCVKNGIPFIYGGAIATYGMTLTVLPKKGPCLRCLFPQMPVPGTLPTCDTFGILNNVPTTIASIQVTEALKLLIGVEPRETLLIYDPWHNDQQDITMARNENCKCCGKGEYDFLDAKERDVVVALCGRDVCSVTPPTGSRVSFEDLEERLKKVGETKSGMATLSVNVDDYEIVLFKDGRALIKGTSDESKAKSLYSRYIGH